MMVERLFLAVRLGYLRFVIVEFPDHTHLLFFICSAFPTTVAVRIIGLSHYHMYRTKNLFKHFISSFLNILERCAWIFIAYLYI